RGEQPHSVAPDETVEFTAPGLAVLDRSTRLSDFPAGAIYGANNCFLPPPVVVVGRLASYNRLAAISQPIPSALSGPLASQSRCGPLLAPLQHADALLLNA